MAEMDTLKGTIPKNAHRAFDVATIKERAMKIIASPMSEPLTIEILCAEIGVSRTWWETHKSELKDVIKEAENKKALQVKKYGYKTLFAASEGGNVYAAEKIIRLLGTREERRNLSGQFIETENTSDVSDYDRFVEMLKGHTPREIPDADDGSIVIIENCS
jgi:hypothetical protein